jgi:YegS/Rv2252/BmrU family lipid kinase
VSRPVLLLVNPAASGGRSLEIATAARAELQLAGVEHRVIHTRGLDHAREEAGAAAREGHLVAACGGDGFVGTVAGAVRDTDGAMAVIPGGRGNDFARVVGIPTDAREAVRLALTGREKLLDMATCNDKPFVCIASWGFDSDANRIANETEVVKGNLVYVYAALKALWQWKPARFTLTVDGERHEMTGYSAGVGNSKAYGGGMYALPEAELDDGELDGCWCADMPKLKFVTRVLPKIFDGSYGELPEVTFFRGKRFEVSADRPFRVYADGDPITDLPAVLTIEPSCLRVVVPSDF